LRFDIETWVDKGWYGRKRLLKARPTPVMTEALRIRLNELGRVGIAHDFGDWVSCWVYPDRDPAEVEAVIVEAEAAARASLAAQAERRAERKAMEAAEREARLREEEALRSETQRALRSLMEARPWLLQGAIGDEARDLVERERLDDAAWRRAQDLVKAAQRTLKKTAEALAIPPAEPGVDRLVDDAFREAVRDGCRHISAADLDRARIANGVGWSKTTSNRGHYLAGKDSLSATEALHGYMLLRVHRAQLTDDLRRELALA
jgi:hypothetical protein